jgi:MoaA/NifB/PqqE/SkfB family radical SAM enzyme
MGTFGNAQRVVRPDQKVRLGPCGVHFFNRRTGLNILLDEVCIPRESWALAPRQVSIALTNACDLSCHYCYAPKNRAELSFNKLITWLCELDANGCLGVGLGGGEPTLYRRFPELCRHLAEKTSMAVTFTTHAHRVTEQLAERLRGTVNFIRVSMDGVGTTYESHRGRSFAAFRSRLEVIRQIAPFGINFVVNKSTLPELNRAVDLASAVGAKEFLLLPEQPVRGVGGIDPTTSVALRVWLDSYHAPLQLTTSEVASDIDPIFVRVPNEEGLRAFAHIDATGVLKRSSYDQRGVMIGPEGLVEALRFLDAGYEETCK